MFDAAGDQAMIPTPTPPCRLCLDYVCPTCGAPIVAVLATLEKPPRATCANGHESDPARLRIETVATPARGKR